MNIFVVTLIASLVVYILIGNFAGRKVKQLDDYYVAGRNGSTLFIIGTLLASLLSTTYFLGEAGMAYDSQAGPFLLFPPLTAIGYIYGALYFGRYLRRSRALTVSDYLGKRFQSRRVQRAAGITIVLGLGGYLVVVNQGAAFILQRITPLSYQQGLVLAWFSYTGFTLYAGTRGVVITDTVMFLLFSAVSFLAFYYIIDLHGGWLATLEGLSLLESKPGLMSYHGVVGPDKDWNTPMDLVIWSVIIWLAWSVVMAVSPWQASRYLVARDEKVVIRSACLAMMILAIIQFALYIPAAAVNLNKTDISPVEDTMVWASLNILPDWMGALMMAGIAAAGFSSASTFLSLIGFSVANDIIDSSAKDEKTMLRFSRKMMLLVGLVALVISLFAPLNIFWITYFVGPIFAASWGPVAFMSVWSKKITADGAFWGLVSGFVGGSVVKGGDMLGWWDLPMYLHEIVLGTLISLITIILVSRQGTVTPQERSIREAMHEVPESEKGRAVDRNWLPLMLVAYGVLILVVMMTWYVKPYHAVINGPEAGIDWLSGESLMIISQLPLMLFMAWLVRRELMKSYRAK